MHLTREGNLLVLLIEDDGVGFPPGFDPVHANGFGLTLVGALAAQLDAELTALTEGGAKFMLKMPASGGHGAIALE